MYRFFWMERHQPGIGEVKLLTTRVKLADRRHNTDNRMPTSSSGSVNLKLTTPSCQDPVVGSWVRDRRPWSLTMPWTPPPPLPCSPELAGRGDDRKLHLTILRYNRKLHLTI